MDEKKKRVFSGIQPTGGLHIGNYIGAIKSWRNLQSEYDSIFCVVDLHAITIPEAINPEELRRQSRHVAALLIACGIDAERSRMFIQSHVHQHSELTWILNCLTPIGWLERMTQYKSKAEKLTSVGMGLLDYPVLQAADILLYDADFVPVGEDQIQHVELARDIVHRFNSIFGEVFVMPRAIVPNMGARIMGFDNPQDKMSKSTSRSTPGHAVWLLDSPETIRRTIMRAVTDSGSETRFRYATPGVLNLLTLYKALSGTSEGDVEKHFEGKGYGFLKREVADLINAEFEPIRTRYQEIVKDEEYIGKVLDDGANSVSKVAEATLNRVKNAMGLG